MGTRRSVIKSINFGRENAAYLPGVRLPEPIEATGRLDELADCEAVFVVVPSRAVSEVAAQLARVSLAEHIPVISCVKGIEKSTGRRMSEVLHGALRHIRSPCSRDQTTPRKSAAASPPPQSSDAPTRSSRRRLQELVTCPWFRAYTSEDLCGIEWGAAVKNVFAIASGMAGGLGLGDNARAALVTRGLAEMIRLGTAMKGRPETFQGLSGVGDLVVTCYSEHSRNNRVGQALGRGQPLADVLSSMRWLPRESQTLKAIITPRAAPASARQSSTPSTQSSTGPALWKGCAPSSPGTHGRNLTEWRGPPACAYAGHPGGDSRQTNNSGGTPEVHAGTDACATV